MPCMHPGLAQVLEFEQQRLGLPIEGRRIDLSDPSSRSPFAPVIELRVHTGHYPDTFPVLLDDESMEVRAPVCFRQDQDLVGFRNHDGSLAPLAGVTGNVVCVYFDLDRVFRHPEEVRRRPTNGTPVSGTPGNRLADLILAQAIPLAVHNIRSHDWSDEVKEYAGRVVAARDQVASEWRRAVRENATALEDKVWEIQNLTRKNEDLLSRIRGYEMLTRRRIIRHAEEDLRQVIRMLGRSLREMELDDGSLVVTTRPISVDFEGHLYEFGCYRMRLPLGEGTVTIHAADPDSRVDGFPHPHVNAQGVPCLGNIGVTLARLLGAGEVSQSITLLLEFLRSYNPENPFLRIERWNPDWEDEENRWESCYDQASLRDCATCDDGDCPHREDAERRCYNNTETRDCIECGDCDYAQRSIVDCRADRSARECVSCSADCSCAGDQDHCFESHAGDDCADCDNEDCTHHPKEDDDEDLR